MVFEPKFTPDTVASIFTAVATIAIALGAWVQLPLVAAQVRELARQLDLSREAENNAEHRAREWETLKICQKYDFDPVLDRVAQNIRRRSQVDGAKDYSKAVPEDLVCVLNYLDGIALGIDQGLYIETIVKEQMERIFKVHVDDFLLSGLADRASFPSLLALHARWFAPQATPSSYKRPLAGKSA
jgi:hypothetical protein